jgi:hypothetical protein
VPWVFEKRFLFAFISNSGKRSSGKGGGLGKRWRPPGKTEKNRKVWGERGNSEFFPQLPYIIY